MSDWLVDWWRQWIVCKWQYFESSFPGGQELTLFTVWICPGREGGYRWRGEGWDKAGVMSQELKTKPPYCCLHKAHFLHCIPPTTPLSLFDGENSSQMSCANAWHISVVKTRESRSDVLNVCRKMSLQMFLSKSDSATLLQRLSHHLGVPQSIILRSSVYWLQDGCFNSAQSTFMWDKCLKFTCHVSFSLHLPESISTTQGKRHNQVVFN